MFIGTMNDMCSHSNARHLFANGKFAELCKLAHEEGMKAGNAHRPTPMTVVQRANPFDDNSEIIKRYPTVFDGVCGYAWVHMPANTKFAKYCMANDIGRKAYGGGMQIWVHEFGQSMERKEAYAKKYAEILSAAGIERVYAQSRMD